MFRFVKLVQFSILFLNNIIDYQIYCIHIAFLYNINYNIAESLFFGGILVRRFFGFWGLGCVSMISVMPEKNWFLELLCEDHRRD